MPEKNPVKESCCKCGDLCNELAEALEWLLENLDDSKRYSAKARDARDLLARAKQGA